MTDFALLISGMMAVTYSVRLLPFLIYNKISFNKKIMDSLNYIPYIALGALFFPGIFESVSNATPGIIIVIIFAATYSWFRKGQLIPVAGSIVIIVLNKVLLKYF